MLFRSQMTENPAIDNTTKESEILEIMTSIDNDQDYKKSVIEKANARGISYQEMLRLDATWVWENKRK